MEYWSDGVMESWSIGVMEYWSNGYLGIADSELCVAR